MSQIRTDRRFPQSLFLLGCMCWLACSGCQPANEYQPPPPPEVTVQKPLRSSVPRYVEFTGNARASATVDLRTRVTGFIESVEFEAGDDVEAGQTLFVIDKAPLQAAVNQYQADLKTREAELKTREAVAASKLRDFERIEKLAKEGAATEQQFTQAAADKAETAAAVLAAKASIASAQAALEQAQIDLGYAEIKAPIAGRVSEKYVDPGNLVTANEQTVLASVVSYSPIYVYFTISERDLLEFRTESLKDKEVKELPSASKPSAEIDIKLANDKDYRIKGQVDYADVTVDSSTGTFLLRAIVPNEDLEILPGYFVRVRATLETDENSLLVADRSIGYDQGGRFVLVVAAENKVEKKYVELGPVIQGWRQVVSGLEGDESVIVDGVQRARPGAPVSPQEIESENPFADGADSSDSQSSSNETAETEDSDA